MEWEDWMEKYFAQVRSCRPSRARSMRPDLEKASWQLNYQEKEEI